MKKIISFVLPAAVLSAAGCNRADDDAITVISREGSSGTRSAFVDIMGIADEDGVDLTTPRAEETQSNNVMMTSVRGNVNAVGYVSLGFLSDGVKTVKIDGAEPTAENIRRGEYRLARPFNIVYKENLPSTVRDFIGYVKSYEGQKTVEEEGYIKVSDNGTDYIPSGAKGKIIIDGSTSVGPVMEKLAEGYMELNPDVTFEIQQTGSSAGISSVFKGVCHMGMASRELKESEIQKGVVSDKIAIDGIVVIVNKNNPVDGFTTEQIRDIYTGDTVLWSKVRSG